MAAMKQKANDAWVRMKDSLGKMPKKKRIVLCAGGVGIILFAVVVTALLNGRSAAYQVIFPGMSPEETSSVYTTLVAKGAQPKLDATGQVMVPAEEYDIWLLALVNDGFPRSTLTYGIYDKYATITATESDRKKGELYQLQDYIRGTLLKMSGVVDAVVTIALPESSGYIWDEVANENRATASVLLTLKDDSTLTPGQVNTIKNLVAKGVPNMKAEDVTVADSKSGLELSGVETPDENGLTSDQTVELERIVQKQIEDNIVRLLAPRYGSGGVVASAKVTLDFAKMQKEQLEIAPKDENGERDEDHITSSKGSLGVNGQESIGGMVGEENNTDIPVYPYVTPGDGNDTTLYSWDTQLDYSYIKTQVEKGNAPITRATISVMVDETSMTANRREELTNLISNGADIPVELISVSAFRPDAIPDGEPAEPTEPTEPVWMTLPLWVYLAAGGVLLVVLLLLVLLARGRKRKRMRLAAAKEAEEEAARMMAEEEIEDYKKQLSAAAKSSNNAKDEAILGEVRDFARQNPEITAGLLRSWLREGE